MRPRVLIAYDLGFRVWGLGVYHLPAAFNDLNEYFAGEARRLGVHTLDIKQMLDRAEFKDHWHLRHSDRNRGLMGPYFDREVQIL